MNDLISVIVPIYNVEKYLPKCIDSIINQTYNNLEIILVDDGSPDNCGEICDEYAEKDARIKVINKENGGLSDARNAGIDASHGNYLSFVDSDDYIAPDMIEVLYNHICEDNSDLALCNFTYVDENFNEIEKMNDGSPMKNELLSGEEALRKLTERKNWYYVVAVNKLYKKELFECIRFPKGKIHEDEFVVHHIFDKCRKISCVENSFYFYVQRNLSIMNSSCSVKRLDAVDAFLDRANFFAEKNLNEMCEKTAYVILKIFQQVAKSIDLNVEENKDRYFNFLKQFKKLYVKKLVKKVCLRANLHFTAFCVNPNLYNVLKFLNGLDLKKGGVRYFINRIFKKTKSIIKRHMRSYQFNNEFKRKTRYLRKKFDKIVFIMATPCHGNLGDHAIVYAEHEMLKKLGYTENIVEISNNEYIAFKNILKKYICGEDIIIIDGGGNLGTLWPHEDDKISEIIDCYKTNKIVVFPQTCYYEESKEGKLRLKRNQEIYWQAKNLTITLRDKQSYDFCAENFKNTKILFVPDIVLSLKREDIKERQNICLLCFRGDCEKVLTDKDKQEIYLFLNNNNIENKEISTIHTNNVSVSERNYVLNEIWSTFSSSKLLLTDRLHAMIFAAITGTPCLALDNKSKKVSGVYNWISNLKYIHVCSCIEEMIDLIPEFYKMGKQEYNTDFLNKEFKKIESVL